MEEFVGIRMSKELRAALELLAAERGVSLSCLIREVLTKAVEVVDASSN